MLRAATATFPPAISTAHSHKRGSNSVHLSSSSRGGACGGAVVVARRHRVSLAVAAAAEPSAATAAVESPVIVEVKLNGDGSHTYKFGR